METENWLLENVDKIRHIPGYIVQGRYDMVCPMYTAWELHEAWPEAQFELMPTAGHSCMGACLSLRLGCRHRSCVMISMPSSGAAPTMAQHPMNDVYPRPSPPRCLSYRAHHLRRPHPRH